MRSLEAALEAHPFPFELELLQKIDIVKGAGWGRCLLDLPVDQVTPRSSSGEPPIRAATAEARGPAPRWHREALFPTPEARG